MDNATEATTEAKKPGVPRTLSPENQKRLDYIVQRVVEQPGISNPEIAKELEITTLTCGQLVDRLVKADKVLLVKREGGGRLYYPPGYDVSTIPPEVLAKPVVARPAKPAAEPAEPEGDNEGADEDEGM